ncbi:MAG: hypothetical protein MZV63_61400 [Marinilabiliales bacterium]|nr:hypothetical protein [Marinilabiliales bacterium]
MVWTISQHPEFTLFLSPLTSKNTFVNDDLLSAAGAFGVEPGKKFRSELGAYAQCGIQEG